MKLFPMLFGTIYLTFCLQPNTNGFVLYLRYGNKRCELCFLPLINNVARPQKLKGSSCLKRVPDGQPPRRWPGASRSKGGSKRVLK